MAEISVRRDRLAISTKQVHEILVRIRGMEIDKAVSLLKDVSSGSTPIPFKRYPSGGHKAGVPVGYPKKASLSIIKMLNELKSNAENFSGVSEKLSISRYDLGRGGYPRYASGRISKRGKKTNIVIYTKVEKKKETKEKKEETPVKPVEATAAQAEVQKTEKEVKDVSKENNSNQNK